MKKLRIFIASFLYLIVTSCMMLPSTPSFYQKNDKLYGRVNDGVVEYNIATKDKNIIQPWNEDDYNQQYRVSNRGSFLLSDGDILYTVISESKRDPYYAAIRISDKKILWKTEVKGVIYNAQIIDSYILINHGGNFSCFDSKTGDLILDKPKYSNIYINNKKLYYIENRHLKAIDIESKKELWKYQDKVSKKSFIKMYDNNLILSDGNHLRCIDPLNGQKIWDKNIKIDLSKDIVFTNEKIQFVSRKEIHCLDVETGDTDWKFEYIGNIVSKLVAYDNLLGVLTNKYVYVLDIKKGTNKWQNKFKNKQISQIGLSNDYLWLWTFNTFNFKDNIMIFDSKSGKDIWKIGY